MRDTDNAVFERGKANYPVATSSASLVQPLFDPARRYRVQRAKSVQSGAEVDYIAAVRDVVFEVFDNYIVASQAKARIASLQERRYLLNRQINSQGALVDTGLSNVLQSSSLRSERDTIAAEESLESARRAEALSNLSQLTGLVVSDLAPLDFPDDLLNAPGRVNVEQAVSTALENNPAIMSAALQVVSTEFERKEAHASDISPVLEAYATIERRFQWVTVKSPLLSCVVWGVMTSWTSAQSNPFLSRLKIYQKMPARKRKKRTRKKCTRSLANGTV